MDEGLSAAVVKVFVALYREGLIYRGTRLVNWDPVSKSTLSDAEVDDEERDGNLWRIRYRGEDGSFSIEVVTTRPETMLGDTAVAVHPDDERYAHLVGKHVVVPLAGRRVPIVADAAVERDFGTGAVKVTPAHDPLDNEIGERHGLEMLTVIGFDAKMTAEAGAVRRARPLRRAQSGWSPTSKRSGHLVSVEPHRHRVPVSSRSGAVVEPLLSLQWFCKMESLAKPALEAYRDGHIRFVPERFGRTYEAWLENIRDWNVSRQVWWGHRLPVWYTPADEPVVAETEEEARAIAQREYGTAELRRDPDTLDTWFSSASVAVLDPWLARPYARTRALVSQSGDDHEPRHHLPVGRAHGDARHEVRRRHSVPRGIHHAARLRSAGPQDEQEPAQRDRSARPRGEVRSRRAALRHAASDAPGVPGAALRRALLREGARLQYEDVERATLRERSAGRFARRWNAAKPGDLTLADRWILTRLRDTVERVTAAIDALRVWRRGRRANRLHWYEYCDWYIEATKIPSPSRAAVLSYVLNAPCGCCTPSRRS